MARLRARRCSRIRTLNGIKGFEVQGLGFRGQGWGVEVKRFRGGLVFKAHRLVYHSTLGLRVIKKKGVDGYKAAKNVESPRCPGQLQRLGFRA